MDVMTVRHKRWDEFVERLEGSEGCNFRKDDKNEITWNCDSEDRTRPLATKILEDMGRFDIEASLEYFNEHGGYCDCEILFNVAPYKKKAPAVKPGL